jgi:hypothetical protein
MASCSIDVRGIFVLLWIAILGCQAKQPTLENKATLEATQLDDWYGVYASMEEYSGIEGQILVLSESPLDKKDSGDFRLKAWIDNAVGNGPDELSIPLDEVSGEFLVSGNQVYIPVPQGRTKDGKVTALTAAIKRYTRVTINQEVVLLPDHALERYENGESLQTTGIIIKLRIAVDDYESFDISSLKSLPSEKLIVK